MILQGGGGGWGGKKNIKSPHPQLPKEIKQFLWQPGELIYITQRKSLTRVWGMFNS